MGNARLPAPRPTGRVESVPGIIGQVAVLTVRDAGRSAAWYCELLGTGETGRYVQPDGRVALVHLAGPRSALEQCLVSHDSAHAQIPYREKNEPQSQKDANRAHAKLARKRANAQLQDWRIPRKLCCCPWRAGQLAKAIHVLQVREAHAG
jgi:hypothetical protein